MTSKSTARETAELLVELLIRRLGGKGSGNFGHAGRPGKVGGSAPEIKSSIGMIAHDGSIQSVDFTEDADENGLTKADHHEHATLWPDRLAMPSQRFRVQEVRSGGELLPGMRIAWLDEPTAADYFAVDDYYHSKGVKIVAHFVKGTGLRTINPRELRDLEGGGEDTLLHKAADAHVPDLKVALRYAFAAVRKRMQGRKIDELENVLPKMLQEELEAVLPGALTRAAISGASIALQLKTLGGKGSGNFGHAGRPGKIGGSSVTYHGTDIESAKKIKKEGLKPSLSGKVFAAKDIRWAYEYAAYKARAHDEVAIVFLKPSARELFGKKEYEHSPSMHYGDLQVPGGYYAGTKPIPAKHIKEIRIYKSRDLLNTSAFDHATLKYRRLEALGDGDLILVDVLEGIRALGGKGSGNFGHAGRPGKIGGSSSSSSLTHEQRIATVTNYTGDSAPINGALRSGKSIPKGYTETVSNLDSLIKSSPLGAAKTFFRIIPTEVVSRWQDGQDFVDPAFVSMTEDAEFQKNVAEELGDSSFIEEYQTVTISAPIGTEVLEVNSVLGARHEFARQKEWILGRGNKFTVSKIGNGFHLQVTK